MDNLAVWLSAISAFFAAMAALANLRQAGKAAEGNQVQVYLAMFNKYGAPEMRNSVLALVDFWEKHHKDVGSAFRQELSHNRENALNIRGHSRVITFYFLHAAKLYEAGTISKKLLKLMITYPGLNVFYDVAVPINLAENPRHESRKYAAALKAVVPKYGEGMFSHRVEEQAHEASL
jgi:hypothetical protein